MQKIPRVEEEVGVAGDPQRLRPCGPKERGERLKGTESPTTLIGPGAQARSHTLRRRSHVLR